MSGGWGCPHEDHGRCRRREADCNPGAEGCVLEERLSLVRGPSSPEALGTGSRARTAPGGRPDG